MDAHTTLCILLLLLTIARPGLGLSIKETVIPVYKIRGEDAVLNCYYDLEGEPLYSVKWYKDDEEFYRYMPGSSPAQSIFSRPGVTVNPSKSNASRVVLTRLDFRSSGLYRCEISVEDSFNTLNRFGRMMVVGECLVTRVCLVGQDVFSRQGVFIWPGCICLFPRVSLVASECLIVESAYLLEYVKQGDSLLQIRWTLHKKTRMQGVLSARLCDTSKSDWKLGLTTRLLE
ncbi:uncharacterized protein [Cherax quadricarinatus]|uniref:uncharacterized protein n=1 Tax=Cherax quadricarinatus TaxID=27406 RepID=UPI00387E6C11